MPTLTNHSRDRDSELTKLAGVVKALKLTLEKQTPDTKDNLIKKQKNKIAALEKSLDDPKNQNPIPTLELILDDLVTVQYVKFEVHEIWHKGGGLQHFSVIQQDGATPGFYNMITKSVKPSNQSPYNI